MQEETETEKETEKINGNGSGKGKIVYTYIGKGKDIPEEWKMDRKRNSNSNSNRNTNAYTKEKARQSKSKRQMQMKDRPSSPHYTLLFERGKTPKCFQRRYQSTGYKEDKRYLLLTMFEIFAAAVCTHTRVNDKKTEHTRTQKCSSPKHPTKYHPYR